MHQNGMASTMAVEHFFAGQRDLYRPPGFHRELGNRDFVTEWIALTAESTAIRAGNHLYAACRHLQHARESAMDIVRSLRRRPQNQLSVRLAQRDRGMLFHRQVRIALIKEGVVENEIGLLRAAAVSPNSNETDL